MRFIRSSREYREVYGKYKKHHGALFLFLYQRHLEESEKAVGIVVSRKVGKAVRRNKVKRRVKAYLREHSKELPFGKVVIIAKASAGEAAWQEIREDLGRNLQALKV